MKAGLEMALVWIVDDEEYILTLIKRYLEKDGHQVRTYSSSEALKAALLNSVPDLFILDIMLPGTDGLALCREIKEQFEIPIIFVSARGDEFDRVLGLELGAEDYLTKPFSPRELVIRVRNLLNRKNPDEEKDRPILFKNLALLPRQRKVTVNDQEVKLTTREFNLLLHLAGSPGRSFSRQQILEAVWGFDYDGEERVVDDTVKRIRKKMNAKEAHPVISTVWGYGYRFDV